MRIGLISDTHGLLRPEVAGAFKGVKLIIHAGDIGSADVLDGLRSMAPVVAVRGNNDREEWADGIPPNELTQIGDVRIYTLHDLHDLDLGHPTADFHVVVSGHSHRPLVETRGKVLYVNPGSAGPRRFKLPVSVAQLIIDGPSVRADLIHLLPE